MEGGGVGQEARGQGVAPREEEVVEGGDGVPLVLRRPVVDPRQALREGEGAQGTLC